MFEFSSEVGFTDAGNYTCIATNNYGTANASGILTVKGMQLNSYSIFTVQYYIKEIFFCFVYRTYKNYG